ncbi:hypothetical protein [Oceanicola sp. S124]|uniref:hypothetical protein n=1 Tax=Oceanicola sp. S124 TaxID=1042378 RepID=UPI0002E45F35|nr:hypothetical protein [Oceanicola sp. S124]
MIWAWKWGLTIRLGRHLLKLRTPTDKPLFSERYGPVRTIASFRGFRLLYDRL